MPPRRSARVAAVAERQCSALAPLPHALVLLIFSLVPVDQRLRCLEVCKGWYAALNERSLWTRLNLSATAGLARPATETLLLAAAARAGGQLEALHLTDCVAIMHEAIVLVCRANADTLTELRMEGCCRYPHRDPFAPVREVEAVLGAAPRLRLVAADVSCNAIADVHRLLRNEGGFAALRVRKLSSFTHNEAGVLALAADLPAHTWLTEVRLFHSPLGTLAVFDAVVDAALTLQINSLMLGACHLTPASAPALARLISGGALTELYVTNQSRQLLDQPAAALVADALRVNSTLTSLKLPSCNLWQNAADAALFLGALTAHRSLRMLDFSFNSSPHAANQQAPDFDAALGALVAANAPALHELNLSYMARHEAELLALLDALPLNTHLRTLNLDDNRWTNDFARDRLLMAVRANTSLRHLIVSQNAQGNEFLQEAEPLVAARNAAAAP
jgi:hypothetical protein